MGRAKWAKGKYKDNKPIRYLYSKKRSNAKSRGLEMALSLDEFGDIVKRPCFWCGSPSSIEVKRPKVEVQWFNGIDRLHNHKGYTKENSVPCCVGCNSLRGPMKLETWVSFITGVVLRWGGEPPIFPNLNVDQKLFSHKRWYRFK